MDDIERRVRRYLLKPLVRRPSAPTDLGATRDALARFSDLPLAEEIIGRMDRILASDEAPSKRWKDPEWVMKMVAVSKALYLGRRISTQEFVFHATSPIVSAHEERITDGFYDDDLAPIEEQLRSIEKANGLQPDEYWPRGEGPSEYVQLNAAYEELLDRKLTEMFREFGVPELAAMKEADQDEFNRLVERGRRSIFQKDEQVAALRDLVIRYEQDARRAARAGAYAAAVTLLGAGAEGLLLMRCLRSPHKAARIASQLPKDARPGKGQDPMRWRFETLLMTCLEAGWLPPIESDVAVFNPAGLANHLRTLRNNIHPGRHTRERPWIEADKREYEDVEAIYTVLLATLG